MRGVCLRIPRKSRVVARTVVPLSGDAHSGTMAEIVGGVLRRRRTSGCARERRCDVAKAVKVEIYDQTYHIRGELDEEYVAELAAFVDAKMRSVAEATRTVDSLRVAVLAALNIADELHALRERQRQIEGPLRQRTERCLVLVEQALRDSA